MKSPLIARFASLGALLFFSGSICLISPVLAGDIKISGNYLLSFHACPKDECAAGPSGHMTYLAQSDDGETWSLVPGWSAYSGSVPDVIRRGNTVYVYNPGQVARLDLQAGVFRAPVTAQIQGLEGGFVDPSLIVDAEGRLVIFFLYGRTGGDPASCPSGQITCQQRIGSATEVPGSDGSLFSLDAGDRVTVGIDRNGTLRTASDPDIFYDGSRYVLYVSHGCSFSVWTSPDLRGTYSRVGDLPDGLLSQNAAGIPAGYHDAGSNRYWSYGHRSSPDQGSVIVYTAHPDFSRQLESGEWSVVASGESMGLGAGISVESPGFAINQP